MAMESGSYRIPVTPLPHLTPVALSKPHKVGTLMIWPLLHHHQLSYKKLLHKWMKDVMMYVCLNIRPDKCYSLLYDGKVATRLPCIIVGGGTTTNVVAKPTTFLGSIVTCSSSSRKKESNSALSSTLPSYLQHLDNTPVRGEYKVWMYRRYVIPSLHYKLSVNGASIYITKKLNSLATRYLKKWPGPLLFYYRGGNSPSSSPKHPYFGELLHICQDFLPCCHDTVTRSHNSRNRPFGPLQPHSWNHR